MAGRPVGRPLPWECWAARSRQARPEEARGASWGAAQGERFERAALPVLFAVSASYVTCGSLDHFLMVSSGTPAASSALPKVSSAIATPSQLVRSARPSNGEAEACTWSGLT